MNLSTAMWTAAVVGAVAVYWFVWVMGSAEVKGKRAVNLKMGSIMRDKVQEVRRPATPSCSGGLSGPSSPPAYLPFLMQDKAAAEDGEKETFSKKPRHCEAEMPLTDSEEDSFLFPVKEIVQYPLPGYVAPSSISFSPDGTLHRKVFAFEVASRRQELVIWPPDGGGLDESNLSAEEKLRSLEPVGILMYTTVPPQAVWGVLEQQHNKKVEATIKEIYNFNLRLRNDRGHLSP
ncbi:hypothetical protein ZIOFF_066364 [Zingiber officinale]|uniref:Uncharacterized protein n=1 Tax=Zingiber officinale TaxID=94328 RepID=A0A8J5EYE3_ZINOF|nr:hypothetical protein ZIOFF_066364 [Zingiber officinale]